MGWGRMVTYEDKLEHNSLTRLANCSFEDEDLAALRIQSMYRGKLGKKAYDAELEEVRGREERSDELRRHEHVLDRGALFYFRT